MLWQLGGEGGGVGGCVLLAVAWLFVKGVLTPRGFAIAGLFYWVAMFAVFYLLIKSLQRSKEDFRREQIAKGIAAESFDREQCVKGIRSVKRLIALFGILFIYGIFSTQGEPPFPRVAGEGFDVLILALFTNALLRLRKKLKGLPAMNTARSVE